MTRRDEQESWDDLTPPTPEELEQARALREALEGRGDHPDAELARALRVAHDPPALDPQANQWLVKRAVAGASSKRGAVVVLFGAGAAMALAAGVALVLTSGVLDGSLAGGAGTSLAEASLIPSRTTQPLFEEPFARHGGTSVRMDRIAQARGRDYRTNRFERMGVRR